MPPRTTRKFHRASTPSDASTEPEIYIPHPDATAHKCLQYFIYNYLSLPSFIDAHHPKHYRPFTHHSKLCIPIIPEATFAGNDVTANRSAFAMVFGRGEILRELDKDEEKEVLKNCELDLFCGVRDGPDDERKEVDIVAIYITVIVEKDETDPARQEWKISVLAQANDVYHQPVKVRVNMNDWDDVLFKDKIGAVLSMQEVQDIDEGMVDEELAIADSSDDNCFVDDYMLPKSKSNHSVHKKPNNDYAVIADKEQMDYAVADGFVSDLSEKENRNAELEDGNSAVVNDYVPPRSKEFHPYPIEIERSDEYYTNINDLASDASHFNKLKTQLESENSIVVDDSVPHMPEFHGHNVEIEDSDEDDGYIGLYMPPVSKSNKQNTEIKREEAGSEGDIESNLDDKEDLMDPQADENTGAQIEEYESDSDSAERFPVDTRMEDDDLAVDAAENHAVTAPPRWEDRVLKAELSVAFKMERDYSEKEVTEFEKLLTWEILVELLQYEARIKEGRTLVLTEPLREMGVRGKGFEMKKVKEKREPKPAQRSAFEDLFSVR